MTDVDIVPSTEAGALVANHYALSLVEGPRAPPLLNPQEKRVPAYLSGSNSSVYSRCPLVLS
ncbi:hypothetical protein AVEN_54666-1, partial [Araneus ventricosus]